MSLVSGSELNIVMEQLEVRTLIYCEIKHLYFALGLNLTKHDRWNWTFFNLTVISYTAWPWLIKPSPNQSTITQ